MQLGGIIEVVSPQRVQEGKGKGFEKILISPVTGGVSGEVQADG